MDWMLVVAGGLTGLLVGLTGVGGGSLMTPLLLLIFGIAPASAVGTDLWFAALTKTTATGIYKKHGTIDWQIVKRLWAGSLPTSALTLCWMHLQSEKVDLGHYLLPAIGVAICITAVGMVFQEKLHAVGRNFRTTDAIKFKAIQPTLTVIAGALLGLLVTLTSVGAGAIGSVMLAYLYPFRMTPPKLVATDVVHAIPLTLFAGFGHLLIGNMDFGLLGNLLVGSVPCVIIGALLSNKVPHKVLRWLLAIVLVLVALKLFNH